MYRTVPIVSIQIQKMKMMKATPQLESGHLMRDYLRRKDRVTCTFNFSSMYIFPLLIVCNQLILNGPTKVARAMVVAPSKVYR